MAPLDHTDPLGGRKAALRAAAVLPAALVVLLGAAPSAGATSPPAQSPIQLAAGGSHTCAVLPAGTVKCWGANGSGQLGDGTTVQRNSPTAVPGLADVQRLAAGSTHTCALFTGGTVKCWGGHAGVAVIGDGSTSTRTTPTSVSGLTGATRIVAQGDITCALITGGTVKCWGGSAKTPAAVTGLSGATDFTTVGQIACAIVTGGTVKCGGLQSFSSATTVSGVTGAVRLVGNNTSACALLTDGTVKCWGFALAICGLPSGCGGGGLFMFAGTVTGLSGATALGAGDGFWCALGSLGAPKCWGADDQSQLGDGKTDYSSAAVAVAGPSGARSIAVGGAHACAEYPNVGVSSTVRCWGSNSSGQLGLGRDGTDLPKAGTPQVVDVDPVADTTPPAAPTIVSRPAQQTNATTATVSFTGEPGGPFSCSSNNGTTWTACISPVVLTAVTAGSHTLKIRQRDAAGNVGPAATVTWTVDRTAPQHPVIATAPDVKTGSDIGTFTFKGEAGSGFRCAIDTGDFAECQTPYTSPPLTDGDHTLHVRQADAAGNVGDETSYTWTIDHVLAGPPTLTGVPAAPTASRSIEIGVESVPGAIYQCSLDDAWYSACTPPFRYSGLADGTHVLSVKAQSPLGNVGAAAIVGWTVDTTPPPPPDPTTTPGGQTNQTSTTVGFSGESKAHFTCSLDGAPASPCDGKVTVTGLAPGDHTMTVIQYDAAGNAGTPLVVRWTIDTKVPDPPTIKTQPPTFTNLTSASFAFTVPTGTTSACSVDGSPWSSCTATKKLSRLKGGAHTFSVKAVRPGGLSSTAGVSWTVDLTPPTIISKLSRRIIRVGTTNLILLDVSSDRTGVKSFEYATTKPKPSAKAKPVKARTMTYDMPLMFNTPAKITWVRIADGAGNWSKWYAN